MKPRLLLIAVLAIATAAMGAAGAVAPSPPPKLAALHLTTLNASVVIPVPYTQELTPVEEVQLVSAITNVYTYLDPRALVVTRREPVFDSHSFGDAAEAVTRVSFSYAVQSVSHTTDTTAPYWAFVDIDGNTVSDEFGLFSTSSTTTSSSSEADAVGFSKDLQNGTLFVFNDHNAVAAPSPPLVATGGAPSPPSPPLDFGNFAADLTLTLAFDFPTSSLTAQYRAGIAGALAETMGIDPSALVFTSVLTASLGGTKVQFNYEVQATSTAYVSDNMYTSPLSLPDKMIPFIQIFSPNGHDAAYGLGHSNFHGGTPASAAFETLLQTKYGVQLGVNGHVYYNDQPTSHRKILATERKLLNACGGVCSGSFLSITAYASSSITFTIIFSSPTNPNTNAIFMPVAYSFAQYMKDNYLTTNYPTYRYIPVTSSTGVTGTTATYTATFASFCGTGTVCTAGGSNTASQAYTFANQAALILTNSATAFVNNYLNGPSIGALAVSSIVLNSSPAAPPVSPRRAAAPASALAH